MELLDATLIELLLAPAVLIPACGLLAMSTSARLSAIIARVRSLHRQRIELWIDLPDNDGSRQARAIQLEGLEVQAHSLIRRARLTRASLLLDYCSIVALLLSSGSLGIAVAWSPAEYAAVILFVLGLLVLLAAVVLSIVDVQQSLRWVTYEHDRIAGLDLAHRKPAGDGFEAAERHSPE